VLAAAEHGSYDLVASEELLEEVKDVLERPKMRRYFPESSISEYIARVKAASLMILGPFAGDVPSHTEDPDDDYLVELALTTNVDVLVSGDPHLRDLGQIRDHDGNVVARVLTPSAFLWEVEG
jgi:putative PIN family toxin of toxin-antitoxin system